MSAADLCTEYRSACNCSLPAGHDEPHSCVCGGSWHYEADGKFVVDSWPSGMSEKFDEIATLNLLLGDVDGEDRL